MPDADEARLTAGIIALARRYGRYGNRRSSALQRRAVGQVHAKRVERIWRREGLWVPACQPKRGRLWQAGGSCVGLRLEYPKHVRAYDFVEDRTHDGRKLCKLMLVDEFGRECLAMVLASRLNGDDVLAALAVSFAERGPPAPDTMMPPRRPSGSAPPPAHLGDGNTPTRTFDLDHPRG